MNRRYSMLLTTALSFLLMAVMPPFALAQKALEIPSGTTIRVRMIDKLSSEQSQVGDTFHGTLDEPIEVNGKQLYPKGADVMGRVTDVHPTGRLSEPGELDLALNTVSSGTVAASIHVEPLIIKGESHSKSNVTNMPPIFLRARCSVRNYLPVQNGRFVAVERCRRTFKTRPRLYRWLAKINYPSCQVIWNESYTLVVSC